MSSTFDEVLARLRAHQVLADVAVRFDEAASVEVVATAEIVKVDPDQRIVTGWAYCTHDRDGAPVVDLSGDRASPEVMERASRGFVLDSQRAADLLHSQKPIARLVESIWVDPDKIAKLGLGSGEGAPTGWLVSFKVEDDAVWEAVKAGDLPAFSIGGTGRRLAVDGESS